MPPSLIITGVCLLLLNLTFVHCYINYYMLCCRSRISSNHGADDKLFDLTMARMSGSRFYSIIFYIISDVLHSNILYSGVCSEIVN